MQRRTMMALAVAALLVPAASFAQQDSTRGGMGRMGGMGMGMGRGGAPQQNSIDWLLTQKDQFRPTADQVTKLQELSAKLIKENQEQRDKLQKLRADAMNGTGDRDAMREQGRSAAEKMRKNDAEASEDAVKLLNDEQKKVVKDLLDKRRKEMEARRSGMGRGGN